MCGISGIVGAGWTCAQLSAMVKSQHHRGPDACGIYTSPCGLAGLGHNRLSIIDLSDAGRQPMSDTLGRYTLVFNGEIYNYLELRRELQAEHEFLTHTDTEVLLAAYQKWGAACLDKFLGMFAFAIWDEQTRTLFAARDRFGVKPFYYHHRADGSLFLGSEIKAIHAAGVTAEPDPVTWSTYLAYGVYDHSERTFWKDIFALSAGHSLIWRSGEVTISRWYDLAERVSQEFDQRPEEVVQEEYLSLLKESVRLRFRADVPVGVNLSGGLDSSLLLGLIHAVQGEESDVKAFTFVTGDANYDELPWVEQMLARTNHPSLVCHLTPEMVPALAESVQNHQDEPFGGLPTLAYANLFERARNESAIVLLDGQGMDEQWAGYDYYSSRVDVGPTKIVQGLNVLPVRPECLTHEFRALALPLDACSAFPDNLQNLQYRDTKFTKIPRALRFNDRVSMRASTELREPFLDHRLFELAMSQPPDRKIKNGIRKFMLRQISGRLLPGGVVEAPKRPLQTPQREWLRGPLSDWASNCLAGTLAAYGNGWLNTKAVKTAWKQYREGESDNSFYVWQWIGLKLALEPKETFV
jgi:asparagine synthase (glutamine-hydrolysing)